MKAIDPTRQEIEEALAFIRGASADEQKKKRVLQSCMMQWLHKNKEEGDNVAAIDSKKETRESYLVKFYAFQARSKDATRNIENERSVSTNKEKFVDMYEWGKEKMDQEMGSSGKIRFKPCPFAGSTDEHMKVSKN